MLNKRLQAVSELIKPCDILMDVGSDHGFLPLYLLLRKMVKKAVVGDLNHGPLVQAKKNFANYEELDVEFVLSNGISHYTGNLDAVVIAGMGFETIQSIILQDLSRFQIVDQIIIQSNTKIELLREFLNKQKFRIVDEALVKDRKYFYPILKVKYDEMTSNLTQTEILFGPILINTKNDVFIEYLKFKRSVELKINMAQKKESSERILIIDALLKTK